MNQMELMQQVAKYLARFSEEVKLLNSDGDFSINKHAENLLVKLLGQVYDLNLQNLNYSESGNYAGIDLLDEKKRIGIQITSTAGSKKIKDCLQKYFRNDIFRKADTIWLFIISGKQEKYSAAPLENLIKAEKEKLVKAGKIRSATQLKFSFSSHVQILDRTDLFRQLSEENSIEKISAVEKLLKKQFALIEEKSDLSHYYQQLKNMYYDVVMNDECGMTLNQIYTEPTFEVSRACFAPKDKRVASLPEDVYCSVDEMYRIHEFVQDTFEGHNPLDLSKQSRFLLLMGYPGQGKSSFCKKLLHDYIDKRKTDQKPIYYFQLRNIRQTRDFIYNPLTILHHEACTMTQQNLDRFEFTKSFLVLDGLDELYMRENLSLDQIEKICVELVRLTEKNPDLQIVLTSRCGYVEERALVRENILIARLAAFSFPFQKEWLARYVCFHPETWLTEKILQQLHKAGRKSHISELIEQPLLLHMVASMKKKVAQNTTRADLYEQLFTELIDRKYASEGNLEVFKNVSKDDLRALIRSIAFAIFQTGEEFITKSDLLKEEGTQRFLSLLPEKNLTESVKGVMIAFYFREVAARIGEEETQESGYAIEFLHKSLREYMTAERIFANMREQFLKKNKAGKYQVDDAATALEIINHNFGKQLVPFEIFQHLIELFPRMEYSERAELADRICLFLPEMLACDFLPGNRTAQTPAPVQFAVNSFSGLWNFVSLLGLNKNYLIDTKTKQLFVQYLKMATSVESQTITHFHLDHQDLSNMNFMHMALNCFSCHHTDFSMADFDRVVFADCELSAAKFEFAGFENVDFINCYISKSNFSYVTFDKVDLTESRFIKCNFDDATFNSVGNKWPEVVAVAESRSLFPVFENCDFTDIKVAKPALVAFRKWNLVGEVIRNGSFYGPGEREDEGENDELMEVALSAKQSKGSEKKPGDSYKKLNGQKKK